MQIAKGLNLADLQFLSVPQTRRLCHELGRPVSQRTLGLAISKGHLPTHQDPYLLDRFGHPRVLIARKDLDAWMKWCVWSYKPNKVKAG
jgi:hypothetical protein